MPTFRIDLPHGQTAVTLNQSQSSSTCRALIFSTGFSTQTSGVFSARQFLWRRFPVRRDARYGFGGNWTKGGRNAQRWYAYELGSQAKPGEGPDLAARQSGFYDILFAGQTAAGETLRLAVTGDQDPGYGSTSKMLSKAALCLAEDDQGAGRRMDSRSAPGRRARESAPGGRRCDLYPHQLTNRRTIMSSLPIPAIAEQWMAAWNSKSPQAMAALGRDNHLGRSCCLTGECYPVFG